MYTAVARKKTSIINSKIIYLSEYTLDSKDPFSIAFISQSKRDTSVIFSVLELGTHLGAHHENRCCNGAPLGEGEIFLREE